MLRKNKKTELYAVVHGTGGWGVKQLRRIRKLHQGVGREKMQKGL